MIDGFEFVSVHIGAEEATRLFRLLLDQTRWKQYAAGFGKPRPRLARGDRCTVGLLQTA
jgi:hypothetical protein